MGNSTSTLCWHCDNFECEWRKKLKPVKGWNAERSYVLMSKGVKIPSAVVHECPEFQRKGKYANDKEWEKEQKRRASAINKLKNAERT